MMKMKKKGKKRQRDEERGKESVNNKFEDKG